MENIDFKASVDVVMELYRKMGALDGMSEKEIQELQKKEEKRQRQIHEKFLQTQKNNKK